MLLGLHHHHSASAFQTPRIGSLRQKISLQARKHILYTQQHAFQRIQNDTAALLNSEILPPLPRDDEDEDESSLQMKFHEHIMTMLTNDKSSHPKEVLTAYDELLGMSKLYKKTKQQQQQQQQPPQHWNKRSSERVIKLRDMFEIIDKEISSSSSSSSEISATELCWKGCVLQPSFDSYEEVANALISSIVFRKIGGWEVCRLLEQMLAQVDRQSSNSDDGSDDDGVKTVKDCINSNLITALSKVGDGPSARQIVYREKIARVQKRKEVEKEMIQKEIRPRQKLQKRNDVAVAAAARENSTVASTKERIDEITLLADQYENDIQTIGGSELNSVTTACSSVSKMRKKGK